MADKGSPFHADDSECVFPNTVPTLDAEPVRCKTCNHTYDERARVVDLGRSHGKAGKDNRMWAGSAYRDAATCGYSGVDFVKTADGYLRAIAFKPKVA